MILGGKEIAEQIKSDVARRVQEEYASKNLPVPRLACIIVGDNKASEVYVRQKKNACEKCGIDSLILTLPEETDKTELIKLIKKLNGDSRVSGILVQLPLPEHLKKNEKEIINTISPAKDVDGLTAENLGKLVSNTNKIAPCTATGVMELLKTTGVSLEGKKACVIGRSELVGKSSALLLTNANATVTLCHSKTKNLKDEVSQADIVVVAVGKPKMITADYIKQGAIVIDVGISRTPQGLVGDVDFENVKDKCSYITPVPGGVGPLTVAYLMQNTLTLHELAQEKSCGKHTSTHRGTKNGNYLL